ncbi:Protein esc2 [Mortierella sp. AM989]|nr:Protein esc2 [Mortierella sp. AM989]
MSDSDTAPAPRKPQPKPRARRAGKSRTDSIGSPTTTSPSTTLSASSPPPQTRRKIEDDFFSKAKNYREVVKEQAEAFLHESEPEVTETSASDNPTPVTDDVPILDFEDEARDVKKPAQEEIVESASKRKREDSLTPPPDLPVRQYPPTMPIHQTNTVPSAVIDLDGPADNDAESELDPELVSIAANITSPSLQSSASMSQSDGTTLSNNSSYNISQSSLETLYGTLSPSNSMSSLPSVVNVLIRMMGFLPNSGSSEQEDAVPVPGMSVKVTMEENTSFRKAMSEYCAQMGYPLSDVVFTFKKSRLIASSTPRSLQFPAIAVVDVYTSGAYKSMREREAHRLEELDRQAQELADLQEAISNPHGQEEGHQQLLKHEGEEVEYLHIKLRGKNTADEKIRVKKTTTINSILKHYKNIKKIPEGTLVQLELDDEVIDPSTTIGSTDVEDDDMLVVRVG